MGVEPPRLAATIGLGEGLEFDVRAYELRRSGRPVKLERIPMELLRLLVEQHGNLVTREQIADRIWGRGVFLDTDNGINGAIRKLRRALKDDPDHPRFIQTVPALGYRYIAPLVPAAPDAPEAQPAADAPSPPEHEVGPARRERPARGWEVAGMTLALLATVAAGAWWSGSGARAQPAGGRAMLAVLPFENFTGDPGQEYFSDGLTEELIAQLGSVDTERLGVIARTSVMAYKGRPAPLGRIGRDLRVAYVLEGSVRRDGTRLRVTVQLVRVRDQSQLWSRQYDRDRSSLLAVQAEIADAVADEIRHTFGDHAPARVAEVGALTPEAYKAYDLYLEGRFFWNKRTPEGLRQAAERFKQAIAADAGFARAHAGLADTYALMSSFGLGAPTDLMPRARAAAMRALELDEGLAAAHTSLALIAENYDWDWKRAESEFQRAIALDPSYATAHHWYAEFLGNQGRFAHALAEIERARQLDPLSLMIATDRGAILYVARQYDRSIEQFQAVREMQPGFTRSNMIIAPYTQKGMVAEALAVLEDPRYASNDAAKWATKAAIYGRAGRKAEAQRALQKLEQLNRRQPVDLNLFVMAYIGAGDNGRAIACIRRLLADRTHAATGMKVNPSLDPLRSDPRFQDLLRQVGLAS